MSSALRPVVVDFAGLLEAPHLKSSAQPDLNPNPACSPTSAATEQLYYCAFPDGGHTWVSAEQVDSLLAPLSPEVSPEELSTFHLPACAVHAGPSPIHNGMHPHEGAATAMNLRLLPAQSDLRLNSACSPTSAADQQNLFITFPEGGGTWVSAAELDTLLPPLSPEVSPTPSLSHLPADGVHAAPSPPQAGLLSHTGTTAGMHYRLQQYPQVAAWLPATVVCSSHVVVQALSQLVSSALVRFASPCMPSVTLSWPVDFGSEHSRC